MQRLVHFDDNPKRRTNSRSRPPPAATNWYNVSPPRAVLALRSAASWRSLVLAAAAGLGHGERVVGCLRRLRYFGRFRLGLSRVEHGGGGRNQYVWHRGARERTALVPELLEVAALRRVLVRFS